MNLLRIIQARRHSIPAQLLEFWPPYYISFKNPFDGGYSVLTDVYRADRGQVVPVLRKDKITHFYKLSGETLAHGDDHIVSPRLFNLKYDHTEYQP